MLNERDEMSLLNTEVELVDADERLARSFDVLGDLDDPDSVINRVAREHASAVAISRTAERPLERGLRWGVTFVMLASFLLIVYAAGTGHAVTAALIAILGGPLLVLLYLGVSMARH